MSTPSQPTADVEHALTEQSQIDLDMDADATVSCTCGQRGSSDALLDHIASHQ